MRFRFAFLYATRSSAAAAHRFFSSPVSRVIINVPYYHRPRVLIQAQEAITEYFHTIRSLPFSQAEQIASNAPKSIASLVSSIPFSSFDDFPRDIRRHISFRPINEADFFFESIGVTSYAHSHGNQFLSDDADFLSTLSALVQYGFPWSKLGLLYTEDSSIFHSSADGLVQRLSELESFGLDKVFLIGICLAFPSLLAESSELYSSIGVLFLDLKCAFRDLDFAGSLEENVEASFRLCRRIKVLYDLGCKKGDTGELINICREKLFQLDELDFIRKADFFYRLGMPKEETGMFLLRYPCLLELDLYNRQISIKDFLINSGFCQAELDILLKKYPHVLGTNEVVNLPGSLRALGLTDWLLHKLKCGDIGPLLPDHFDSAIVCNREMDLHFQNDLEDVKLVRREFFLSCKLEFLLGIGFGRNDFTIRALRLLMGTRDQLQERFDFLLSLGIEYPALCTMVSARPKILNHGTRVVSEKVKFLCNEICLTVQYLQRFPSYICFDLDYRIKPRYRMLDWLKSKGLLKNQLSPASVISTSEKRYIAFLKQSHPAAPKMWFALFKC